MTDTWMGSLPCNPRQIPFLCLHFKDFCNFCTFEKNCQLQDHISARPEHSSRAGRQSPHIHEVPRRWRRPSFPRFSSQFNYRRSSIRPTLYRRTKTENQLAATPWYSPPCIASTQGSSTLHRLRSRMTQSASDSSELQTSRERRISNCLGVCLTCIPSPIALIKPAQAHPEVIIAAVAARDRSRAEAYAKKHGIPIVHDSYEGTIPNVTELRSSV